MRNKLSQAEREVLLSIRDGKALPTRGKLQRITLSHAKAISSLKLRHIILQRPQGGYELADPDKLQELLAKTVLKKQIISEVLYEKIISGAFNKPEMYFQVKGGQIFFWDKDDEINGFKIAHVTVANAVFDVKTLGATGITKLIEDTSNILWHNF